MPRFAISQQRRRRRPSDKFRYTAKQWRLGQAAERRFFNAIESSEMRYPEWMYDVTPANPEQNKAGFDVSIGGDFGRVYLNIKYAQSAVDHFHARDNRRLIPCIVIDTCDTNQAVIEKLHQVVGKLRKEIFARRRVAENV